MASQNIAFDQIPASIRKPGQYFEFNTKLALRTLPANLQKMLVIGQRTSAATVPALVPTQIFGDADAEAYFGVGSIAHLMARAAITAYPYLDLTVIALDDALAGQAATGSVTVTGPATSSGTFSLFIGDVEIDIAVAKDEAANDIASALAAELDNHPDLPVIASVDGAVVTLTARNRGVCGNAIGLACAVSAGGVGIVNAVAAKGTITMVGVATADQTFAIGAQTFTWKAARAALPGGAGQVTIGAGADQACTNIIAAVTADLATVTAKRGPGNTVIITSVTPGAAGNNLIFTTASTNMGVDGAGKLGGTTSGADAACTSMTGGATDPDVKDALDAVFAKQYNIVAIPYNNSTALGKVADYLDSVSGPIEERPGMAYYAFTGALGDATTLAGEVNHGRISGAHLRYSAATSLRSMPCEIAAAYAAVCASEEDPARPLNTLPLAGIAPPNINDRLSRTEQESELHNGVSPLEVGPGENVQIVRAISTYTVNASNIPDISMLDITTIRTLDYFREACRERIALRFPREKLSSKTPDKVRAELLDVATLCEDLEIVENVDANKDGLVVERDLQDPNRLDAKIPADVVNGLHVFAGRIDLIL